MPLLNGRHHDWVSLNLILPSIGQRPMTIQSVTYPAHTVEAPDVHGNGSKPIGYTRGQYSVEGLEVEFIASEWDAIRTILGPGYMMTARLPITIVYIDTGLTARKDEFIDCKITVEGQAISMGTDALKTKVTFKPSEMILNGVPAVLAITA
jgi:hypothetical protein